MLPFNDVICAVPALNRPLSLIWTIFSFETTFYLRFLHDWSIGPRNPEAARWDSGWGWCPYWPARLHCPQTNIEFYEICTCLLLAVAHRFPTLIFRIPLRWILCSSNSGRQPINMFVVWAIASDQVGSPTGVSYGTWIGYFTCWTRLNGYPSIV